jgi:hypothetical protein
MTSILRGPRPDLTPAQVVGVLLAAIPVIANLLRAFGLYDVSAEQQQALQEAMTWGGVVAGLLFASDAGVRAARNAADARRDAALLSAPAAPHDVSGALTPPDLAPAGDAALDALLNRRPRATPDAPEAER